MTNPATKKSKVILFQGDSITDGNRGRDEDPNHILGHSYAYIIGGKLGNERAEENLVFYNRGVSGDRISDLYARWNEDAISLQPDIISILIGVNDIWRMMKEDQVELRTVLNALTVTYLKKHVKFCHIRSWFYVSLLF